MSAALLDAAQAHIRSLFTRQQVLDVQPYGGEFSAAEIDKLSFSCPAVLLGVLGWQPGEATGRLRGRHARKVRMAAFIVTKHVRRTDRMLEAMSLADRLCIGLRNWQPASTTAFDLAALDEPPSAENLYGRAVDQAGLALWLVDWTQSIAPKPGLTDSELFDLLRVDITDTTQQGMVPAAPAGPTGLVVTEDVQFKTPI